MLFSSGQLINQIIEPCLKHIDCYSLEIAHFLCALAQANNNDQKDMYFGPYSMSHEQHWSLWDNHLVLHPAMASRVRGLASQHRFLEDPDSELNLNWGYAIAIAVLWISMHTAKPLKQMTMDDLISVWFKQKSNNGTIKYSQFLVAYRQLTHEIGEKVA